MFAFAQTLFFIITNPPQDTTYIFTELTLFCNRFEVTNVKTAGIITEYNPLHYGHLALIQAVRQQFGEDIAIICAMSGDFVQRGDFAVERAHARAEAAVYGGADLVLELPLPWAISSAEGFARGGVSILAATGVVDTLAFGSECGNAAKLQRAAKSLLRADFPDALREELAKGLSFAAARESAARALIGEDAAVLREPNDILGVEYCKALLQSGSTIAPLAILRKVVGHNGGAAKGFASASHIRELLTNGEDASAYLTAESAAIYARECAAGRAPVTMQNAERAVLSRLRAMCEEDFARYDSGNEGLYRRFYDAARTAASVDELLSAVKTKRYAYARLRRMLLAAYLDIAAAELPQEIPYLRVLACNERGRKLLKTIKKTGSAPVLTKSADVRALSEEAQKLFALTARAADQYVLAYPELRAARGSSAWTEGPVIV